MRELTLKTNDPKLKINGVEFKVLLNDAEIMHLANEIKERCSGIDPNDTKKLLETSRYLAASIDRVLGEGAVEAISNGAPVSVKRLVEWVNLIVDNALAAQFDKMVEDND